MPASDKYHVPNLSRALDILECLAAHPQGLGLSEIATTLKFPKNSVFRIATTLEDRGYLLRDESRRYFISTKLLVLGYASLDESTLVEKAVDLLRELRDQTRQTVQIGTLAEAEGIVLEQIASTEMIRFMVNPGTRFPLHCSAPGKAMLAFLPERERDGLLARLGYARFNERTLTTRAQLERELAVVKRTGHAVDNAEQYAAIRCVGAPVFNLHGYPIAAIWVSGLVDQMPADQDLADMGGQVVRTAGLISRRLGWYGGHASADGHAVKTSSDNLKEPT